MLKDDILIIVGLMRIRPTQLLDQLRVTEETTNAGRYVAIQDALCSLLEAGELILSSDRYLEIAQKLARYQKV